MDCLDSSGPLESLGSPEVLRRFSSLKPLCVLGALELSDALIAWCPFLSWNFSDQWTLGIPLHVGPLGFPGRIALPGRIGPLTPFGFLGH